jgi:hypothetical protein
LRRPEWALEDRGLAQRIARTAALRRAGVVEAIVLGKALFGGPLSVAH